ncbi:MAG: hypothetical protein ACP5XB_25960 [Isosphaeraceae bacterium]
MLAAILLAIALLGGWTGLRRRRKARDTRTATSGRGISLDDSPSGKLLNLAEEVRGTLITRFGPTMRARTTEEIAADSQLKEVLGAERLDTLVHLLGEADRWKFATQPANGSEQSLLSDLSAWDAWHKALLADSSAKAKPQPAKKAEEPKNNGSRTPGKQKST